MLEQKDPRIVPVKIEEELKTSFLDYSMSTILARALPDVRDGLKPSQRRILVAMNDLNLSPGRKHSKCAGIVGETMKKYHPREGDYRSRTTNPWSPRSSPRGPWTPW